MVVLSLSVPAQDVGTAGGADRDGCYLRIGFYMNQGRLEEAEKLIDECLATYPRDPFILTEKANILFQSKGDSEGALKVLAEVDEIYPLYFYADYLHASMLFSSFLQERKDKSLLDEALKYLDASIRQNDQFFDSSFMAGVIASEKGDFAASNRYFDRANRLKQVPACYFYMAYNYRELGDLDGEAGAYENIVRLDPENERALMPLAEVYLRKRDYYKSYRILNEIREEDRNNIYYSLFFEILSRLDLNERIVQTYRLVRQQDDMLKTLSVNDYYHVVFAFGNLNRFDEAYQAAQYIRDKSEREKEMLNELSALIRAFLKAEEVGAEGIHYDYNLFVLIDFYKNRNQLQQGIRLLERLVQKRANLYLLLELCEHYIRQEQPQKVESCLKKLRARYPTAVEWKNFYAYFLAQRDKELDLALSLSGETLKEDGESPAYIDTYGYILYKMGKYDEALPYLRRAYEKNPFEREIIQHIVDCYRQQGAGDEIVKIYERAIRHGVDFKNELVEKLKGVK